MSLRTVEITLPNTEYENAKNVISQIGEDIVIQNTFLQSRENTFLLKVLVLAGHSEKLIDNFREKFSSIDNFRLTVTAIEATIPHVEVKPSPDPQVKQSWLGRGLFDRISRDELLHEIEQMVRISPTFCILVALSTVVASVGLYRNSIPVLVGAMVIAPLLGPNIGLAFGTALGDLKLIKNALQINLLGIACAFLISLGLGMLWAKDQEIFALADRTTAGIDDIVLALASGVAGVLSLTGGASATLVGVMVAVALLPPLVATGLFVSSGLYEPALTSFTLLGINIISVNLAGVATFVALKIHPFNWWEEKRAKRLTRRAAMLWSFFLIILAWLLILRSNLAQQ